MRFRTSWYYAAAVLFAASIQCTTLSADQTSDDTSREQSLKQVTYDIKFLASDELGGRQPGTPGMEKAEAHIIEEFKKAGLKPCGDEGTFRQAFDVGRTRELDKESAALTLKGPEGAELKLELDKNFRPCTSRNSIELDAPLVFVTYGIDAGEDLNYNDYRDLDVEGKIIVMIRREPQQENADSVFDGKDVSQFSYIQAKVRTARNKKAAGIILVNDGLSAPDDEKDTLVEADQFGSATNSIPFLHVKRSVIDELLKKTPVAKADGTKLSSLAEIEAAVDANLEPLSQPLEGWTAVAKADFNRKSVMAYNIVGVVEGEGPNADETIVIGGHHDHLGLGAYGSRAPGRREVHNGADDNATGTAAVMELARRFAGAEKKPGRRLVFVCFSAEEMGLLGANHYVFPLENTVAMINFDMIGWLRNDRLTIYNWNTSPEFAAVIDKANEQFKLDLVKPAQGFAGSDHLPFNNRQVPNVFFHTGLTDTYHTPEDDFETIDCGGALKVIEYTEAFSAGLSDLETRPKYGVPKRVRLGVMLEEVGEGDDRMVTIRAVTDDSLASRAGLQDGDVILSIGDETVTRRRQVNRIVRRDSGKTLGFKIKRGETEMTLNIELKPLDDD